MADLKKTGEEIKNDLIAKGQNVLKDTLLQEGKPSGEEKKEGKTKKKKGLGKSAQNTAKRVGLAILTNPKTYKIAGKLIAGIVAAINDDEHWGGESNSATGAIGPYIHRVDNKNAATIQYTLLKSGALSNWINVDPVKAKLSTLIESFDKRLGFPSSLTVTDITTYIGAAMDYLATIVWVKKHYDAKNCALVENVKFSDLMSHLHGVDTGLTVSSGVTSSSRNLFKKIDHAKITYSSISNASWMQDYVSYATDLYLLPQHRDLIMYTYNGFFSNGIDNGINAVLDVCPTQYCGLVDKASYTSTAQEIKLKDMLDSALTALTTARSANRYITQFLQFLGFSTNNITSDMLQRDITGTSYIMKLHDDFVPAIENMFNSVDATTDTVIVYNRTNDIDFTFDETFGKLSVGRIGEYLKFNWLGVRPYLYAGYTDEGTYTDYNEVTDNFRFNVTFAVWRTSTAPTITQTQMNYLQLSKSSYNNAFFYSEDIYTWMGMTNVSPVVNEVALYDSTTSASSAPISFTPQITQVSKKVLIYGSDTIMIPNADLFIKICKVNFTLGNDYARKMETALDAIQRSLLIG